MSDMTIRVVSEGLAGQTKILYADSNEPIPFAVRRIEWDLDGEKRMATGKLHVDLMPCDIKFEVSRLDLLQQFIEQATDQERLTIYRLLNRQYGCRM